MRMVHVFSRTPVLFLLYILVLGPARILAKHQIPPAEAEDFTLTVADMRGNTDPSNYVTSVVDMLGVEKVNQQLR
jgi:hypothetical protein